jgi:hypothetical protein
LSNETDFILELFWQRRSVSVRDGHPYAPDGATAANTQAARAQDETTELVRSERRPALSEMSPGERERVKGRETQTKFTLAVKRRSKC